MPGMVRKPRPPVPGKLDHGIAKAVNILRENGIETCHSFLSVI